MFKFLGFLVQLFQNFFVCLFQFMNVDIRVVVDVTEGNVDVFFSPESQMFIVNTNKVKILLKILLKLFLLTSFC